MVVKITEVLDESTRKVREPRTMIPRRSTEDMEYRPMSHLRRDWREVNEELRGILTELANGRKCWPLYLWGRVGVGKTRAVLAFCDHLARAYYWTVRKVMNAMLARETPWGRYKCYLAVLDELAKHERAGDFEYDAVLDFVDWREDLPAIYISNHPPGFMKPHYCERVESRITCGTVYELKGHDRRKDRQ